MTVQLSPPARASLDALLGCPGAGIAELTAAAAEIAEEERGAFVSEFMRSRLGAEQCDNIEACSDAQVKLANLLADMAGQAFEEMLTTMQALNPAVRRTARRMAQLMPHMLACLQARDQVLGLARRPIEHHLFMFNDERLAPLIANARKQAIQEANRS